MENSKRGMRPRVWLGVVVGAGLTWACGDVGLNVIGDAMVDVGETLADSGCALAQDGSCGAEEHGSVDVVCDRHAEWEWSVAGGSAFPASMDFALIEVPHRRIWVERCRTGISDTGYCESPNIDCVDAGGSPPWSTCESMPVVWVDDMVRVECLPHTAYSVRW